MLQATSCALDSSAGLIGSSVIFSGEKSERLWDEMDSVLEASLLVVAVGVLGDDAGNDEPLW